MDTDDFESTRRTTRAQPRGAAALFAEYEERRSAGALLADYEEGRRIAEAAKARWLAEATIREMPTEEQLAAQSALAARARAIEARLGARYGLNDRKTNVDALVASAKIVLEQLGDRVKVAEAQLARQPVALTSPAGDQEISPRPG